MSTLDQPLLIANSNYHVGHQIAVFVAREQGYFREEGLKEYELKPALQTALAAQEKYGF